MSGEANLMDVVPPRCLENTNPVGCKDFWEWEMFSSLKNKNRSRKIEPRESKTFGKAPICMHQ